MHKPLLMTSYFIYFFLLMLPLTLIWLRKDIINTSLINKKCTEAEHGRACNYFHSSHYLEKTISEQPLFLSLVFVLYWCSLRNTKFSGP